MGNTDMRTVTYRLPTAACISAVVSLLVLAPSVAPAGNYPYCIKGDYYVSAAGDCSFDTYQQCLCDGNPFYRPQDDDAAPYPDV